MKVTIEILNGPMDGQKFELNKAEITIGREPPKDILLPYNHYISRNHAIIKYKNGKFWIIDKSTNGTYLKKEKIHKSRTELLPNSIFTLGIENGTKLVIRLKDTRKKKNKKAQEIKTENTILSAVFF